MRILMHVRPDWRELSGGDLVQLQRWTVWLRELGVDVQVSDETYPDLQGVDLVHFHNLGRMFALWPTLRHCRERGVATVLTPLYWPTDEYERYGRPGIVGRLNWLLPRGLRERLKSAARFVRQKGQRLTLLRELIHGNTAMARQSLAYFDALVPNSRAEAAALKTLTHDAPPMRIVPTGVDAYYWSNNRALWRLEKPILVKSSTRSDEYDAEEEATPPAQRSGVLCVARFDPQKGQHRLIKALCGSSIQLTLTGPDNPNYPGFRDYCRRLASSNVTILPRQSTPELKRLYQSCVVHALPSWYELAGLTGLEAACCGARVVMTDRGGTRDYGGDLAWYANPAELSSIRTAVEAALSAPHTPTLRARVVRELTWEQSSRVLHSVYEQVLSARRSGRKAA